MRVTLTDDGKVVRAPVNPNDVPKVLERLEEQTAKAVERDKKAWSRRHKKA